MRLGAWLSLLFSGEAAASRCTGVKASLHRQRRPFWIGAPALVAANFPSLGSCTQTVFSVRRLFCTTIGAPQQGCFQCVCVWQPRNGVRFTTASSLGVQQRFYATSADRHDASLLVGSAEELEKVFFDYPVAERLAALTVARHEVAHGAASTEASPTVDTSSSSPFMPVKDFVKKMSPLTRDDIFRRHIDALEWITLSKLLQLVDERGKLIPLDSLRAYPAVQASVSERGTTPATAYNGLVHVRTTVPAAWLLQAGGGTGGKSDVKKSCSQPRYSAPSSPQVANVASAVSEPQPASDESGDESALGAALSSAEKEKIIREAFLRALHSWDKSIQLRRERASVTGDPVSCLSRYVHLTTLYNMILREATVSTSVHTPHEGEEAVVPHAPLTSTERYVLKRLRIDTLESIVDNNGVVVTVGSSAGVGGHAPTTYPALSSRSMWVVRGTTRNPATFVALRHPEDESPPRFRYVQPRVTVATRANNYGGWGSEEVVPTKADVYEILKYVPVNWGSLGNLNLPPEVRKKHIRASSTLAWFRRQPFYFELRDMSGTVEVRRSIVLHPEAHGFTKEEAWEVLELQLATGDANSLVPLGVDGVPLRPTESVFDRSVTKFVYRVCPTYFAPLSLTMQRYIKKNLTEPVLMAFVRRFPQDFEILTTRYSDIPLVRRRAGADSARWLSDFVGDLESYPEDVRAIMALCNGMCVAWDRPEYIYVRLSAAEQTIVGGYAGMQKIFSRHPAIFRVGEHFVCRADPSNPLAQREVEPAADDVTAIAPIHQENPYHSPKELALVFHYVMPDDEPCTASYLVDCSSPAMRALLPPRLVTIVQLFPKMFACTETSPGVYSIRKVRQVTRTAIRAGAKSATVDGSENSEEENVVRMLEDEIADEDHMTREEVVQAVRMLIPESGVEAPQLLLWASMNVQRAANEYFGGVLRLVESMPGHFRVATNEQTKMIYKK